MLRTRSPLEIPVQAFMFGAKGAEFYEEKAEGNTMVIGHARKRTEQVARDLKTFCRTVENDYHLTNRRRRIF